MQNEGLIGIFLTGLLAGGLSCMAVQGGLFTAAIAQREEERLKRRVTRGQIVPIFSFLLAKLVVYTLLGMLLGWFGSLFQIAPQMQIFMYGAVAIYMTGTALAILNVHPFFRHFIIAPPQFLMRFVNRQTDTADIFAPSLLGATTVLIPCGTTQAMMALAIATGNPVSGALVLLAFILGTSPLFILLGFLTTKLGSIFHRKFIKLAAFAIILLAIYNFNNALSLTGTNITLDNMAKNVWCTFSYCDGAIPDPTNNAFITIESAGYFPNELTVVKGSPVTLHLQNNSGNGCTQTFTIPKLGVQKIIPVGESGSITFTAPSDAQQLSFMCSNGTYKGVIHLI